MAKKDKEGRKGHVGYGSSYRRGDGDDLISRSEIGAVLGGQVWMVRPDREANAANPCIWMQTGVVRFKNCNGFYDCAVCKYDMAMRQRVESGKQTGWQDMMRTRSGLKRVCRHSLTNRIEGRACSYNYDCSRCDFDQFFEDVWSAKTKSIPYEVRNIKGFEVPMGYYFHNGHTWVRIESGGYIRVGMDDFALKLLGKADAFDLPLMGKEFNKDEVGWGLRRGDNTADVISPVDGVVVEVNSELRDKPDLSNREPYSGGWLFMLRTPDVKKAAKVLMPDTESIQWFNTEIDILEKMIEDVAGPLAADGGYLSGDIYGSLPGLGWKNLTKTFLKN